ncbi:MAG: DUF6178 family protein [Pseudomonadota bacterium]
MDSERCSVPFHKNKIKHVPPDPVVLLKELQSLPGAKMLNRIFKLEDPEKFIQDLSLEDFFWLVKMIGEEDSLPLLGLASDDQWQYLIDLEIWSKDRLDLAQSSRWLQRLQMADMNRLTKWLLGPGEILTNYYFINNIDVITFTGRGEAYNVPDGFFTLDDLFYIKVRDPELQDAIETLLRAMASEDFIRYQGLLLGLEGVIPSELEEEMYRLRSLRLAEHGFLPFEEALSVYAPLNPEALGIKTPDRLMDVVFDENLRSLIPVSPLNHTGTQNMLTEVISGISDPVLMDRLRLEFAGLCNQILSADSISVKDMDDLKKTCRKAARYLNLALERLSGKDLPLAEQILKNHSLVSIFRVGCGLALKLRWEAEKWLKGSWFQSLGLSAQFWGEYWGGTLACLMKKRPLFYAGAPGEERRDFEWLSELSESINVLRRLMVLDSLMERLAETYSKDENLFRQREMTFYILLFNLWGRLKLGMEPCFSGIPLREVILLFKKLRSQDKGPPYLMSDWKRAFIQDLMSYISHSEPHVSRILEETLSQVWDQFREEYEWVSLENIDPRYSKYILIKKD